LIALARVLAAPQAGDPPPGFFPGIEQAAVWMALRAVVALATVATASRLAKRPVLGG
jgi:hypothetical protein